MKPTLIENVEVWAPEHRGKQSLLLGGGRVLHAGAIDVRSLAATGIDLDVIDGTSLLAIPSLIDPHVHLTGGSGEEGFATQTPEIFAHELLLGGITTAVGVLGTDTTTRTMRALLGRVKGMREEGLAAFAWTGGYGFPHETVTGSVRDDIVLIDEIIGAGEIAIADRRSMEPTALDLARLATDCYVAGTLTGKAGILHLHVGEGRQRLAIVREVLEGFEVEPGWFYPTHLERNEKLMDEAVTLSKKGMPVDLDLYEEDLPKWLRFFSDRGGDLRLLTVSSDAAINSPRTLWSQLQACVRGKILPFEQLIALATYNTAKILKLEDRGSIQTGGAADIVLLDRDSLEISTVFLGGRKVVVEGELQFGESFLSRSNRQIQLTGRRAPE